MEIWKVFKTTKRSTWEVSNEGRTKKNGEIKLLPISDGRYYFRNDLGSLHRIVAFAFIPNPENKPQVNHINGIKTDNRVENLEWCTPLENMQHASVNNLMAKGESNGFSKLTESQVIKIKQKLLLKQTQNSIAKEFNVSQSAICLIKTGKSWAWI